ncbi:MAG: adenylate/guanylate cyclase domain-containing protein [Anaerolineales bacterium]
MDHQQKLDDTNAIKVANNIWWVGFADYEAGFSNNPYLWVDDDGVEAILIDPGPGHPAFRDIILQKIRQVIDPARIRYLIVHHQDPDLCGVIPYLENILHPDAVILSHPRTTLMLPYYGLRKSVLPIGDEDVLEMRSGRRLIFYHAPYLHFSGNMITYDETTQSLFSGDIFAVFNRDWSLYADKTYLPMVKAFLDHYTDNPEAIRYAYDKMKALEIQRILPQHGGIIQGDEDVALFLDSLLETEPGELLRELQSKPDPAQCGALLAAGLTYLRAQMDDATLAADSLDALLALAQEHKPGAVSAVIEIIDRKAREIGVADPLTYGRTHRADAIQAIENTQIVEAVRRRFLSRHYGISEITSESTSDILNYGLISFKTDLAVMFVDIRNFTQWCDGRPSDEIVMTLNQQHEVMSKLINANGGRVNKVLGDGLLAYFPTQHLADCVDVAMRIHQTLAENKALLPVGIGCDFGEVTMGDIGEEARLDYTLIGTPVNIASRMCNEAASGEIVLTARFTTQLDDDLRVMLLDQPGFEQLTVHQKPGDPEIEGVKFAPPTNQPKD